MAECGVIGVPDALRGQAIKAVVVLGSGYAPSKKLELEIKEFCNKKLAEFKWIRSVEFVEEMPRTISGKTAELCCAAKWRAIKRLKDAFISIAAQ